MSEPHPLSVDNLMPNVIGKTVAQAETEIQEHADHPVTFNIVGGGGDSSHVASTTPSAGQTITSQVTLVVYNTTK